MGRLVDVPLYSFDSALKAIEQPGSIKQNKEHPYSVHGQVNPQRVVELV